MKTKAMKEYGLIGYPLGHSFSKMYFNDKFHRERIDARYELFPMEHFDRELLMRLVESRPNLAGFNVTIPYKEEVCAICDELSADAAKIGAVNTVVVERSGEGVRLIGHNTDWRAFYDTLSEYNPAEGTEALLFGTGGASKALQYALLKKGIGCKVVSRTPKHGKDVICYGDIGHEMMERHMLLVNATPVGMYPATEECLPIPYQYVTPRHMLYDIVYNPTITEFMRRGAERGATVKNGLAMLYGQAELAWRIWTGEKL